MELHGTFNDVDDDDKTKQWIQGRSQDFEALVPGTWLCKTPRL